MKKKTITIDQYAEYLWLRFVDQELKVRFTNKRRAELLAKIRSGKYSGGNLARYKKLYREILVSLKEDRAEKKRRAIELFS